MSAAWSLQMAIYKTLAENSEITTRLGAARVYDRVPRNATFPYITFGRTRVLDWSTSTEQGEEHTLSLHVWSREKGRQFVLKTMDAIVRALDHAPLNVMDHHVISFQHERSEAVLEADRRTHHGMMRFRVITEPKVENSKSDVQT